MSSFIVHKTSVACYVMKKKLQWRQPDVRFRQRRSKQSGHALLDTHTHTHTYIGPGLSALQSFAGQLEHTFSRAFWTVTIPPPSWCISVLSFLSLSYSLPLCLIGSLSLSLSPCRHMSFSRGKSGSLLITAEEIQQWECKRPAGKWDMEGEEKEKWREELK